MTKAENFNQSENKKRLPKWLIIVIILVFIFVFLPSMFLAGFLVYYDFNEDKIINSRINEDLEILKQVTGTYNDETNTYIITGYIKNKSKRIYEDIEISYVLYDENNNIIGITESHLEKLDKNKTWKFVAEYTGSNAKSISHFEKSSFTADYETWLD